MADIEVTLNRSENYSESTAKTYRGYVINLCDDSHIDDGTWDVTSISYTGYKINSNKIDVWNVNTTSSDKSSTFTWTSSKVDGCTKTLKVTVPGAVVTLKSGNTEIVVTATYDNSGTVYNTSYEDEFLINGSSEGIVTTLSVLTGETITTCNGDMDRYWSNHISSTSNTNKMNFAFNNGLNTHLIDCSDDYNSSGSYTINLKYYDREMTISFPVTFNLTHLANYKFYKHESTLVEISSASETYTIDNNHTYSLNDIIRGGYYYACAESSTDNSISASLLNVSNFSSNNSNFTSSSLAINDNDSKPSGRFYIGVKCNTNYLVNLFNGNSAFSATMTFDLSYSNASIPVTININKVEPVEPTRIINIKLGLTCNLEYTNVYCDSDGGHNTGVPLKWEIKCNNITEISYKNTNLMTKGLNTVLGSETKIKGYDGIRPSGVVLINMPIVPVLSTGAFTISVSGDGSGSKTFIGKSNRCPLDGANYYTYDENLNNLNLEVPFEVLNDGDEININISVA